MTPTREEVICTWPSCGHSARGQCNSHQLTGLRPGNHTVDLLVAENAALRERLEAVELAHDTVCGALATATAQITAARAREAAAWEAGRKVGAGKGGCGHPCGYDCNGACFTPPTDATAALTAVKDAEWDAAIEAAGNLESIHGYSNAVPRHRIRALRRRPA